MAAYSNSSPYFKTSQENNYLDVITFLDISPSTDDVEYELDKKYEYRPDLLAYDLYRDVGLWWVFSVRNKSTIRDPIFDFVAGTKIFLPSVNTINSVLGL